jgi:hypothetical protein
MDKDTFTGITTPVWWLLDIELAPDELKEKRKELGKCWGWEDEGWFAQPDRIVAVYDFLYPGYQTLLDELDTQIVEVSVRTKWIDDLIKAKTDSAKQTATPTTTPTEKAVAPPATDKAVPRPGDTPAPKKASAFGRMKAAEETPSGPPADTGVTAGAAAGTPAAGGTSAAAEPRKPSPFAKKAAATEPAAQTPAGGAETAVSAATAAAGTESVEQIKASLSELVADPNVPINQQEADQLLQDPDFARHLAEAEAAIEAELEAELAAAEAQG